MEKEGERKKKAKWQRRWLLRANSHTDRMGRHVRNISRASVQKLSRTESHGTEWRLLTTRPKTDLLQLPVESSSVSDRLFPESSIYGSPLNAMALLNHTWHPTPLSFLPQDISLPALTGCMATEQTEHQAPTSADLTERLVVWQLARPWSLSPGSPP